MGLDQYAWALPKRPASDADFELDTDQFIVNGYPECFQHDDVFGDLFVCTPESGVSALAHWRKHPDLHGFMRSVYAAKGGTEFHWDEFAGPVVLDMADIDELERLTNERKLPHTTGFFFGASGRDDDAPTVEFCRRARQAIADGKTVVYDSSW